MIKVLFVCLGNICRSPAAEAVFNALIRENGLGDKLQCDSAGTDAYHVGEPADYRMKQIARQRNYECTSISRKFNSKLDFDLFNYIMAMDKQNLNNLKSMAKNDSERNKIFLITDFCSTSQHNSVPDPYYGGNAGFELVLDILEDACSGLFRHIYKD